MTGQKHSFFYNWGSITTIIPDIRTQELAARATWFIKMRWIAIAACAAGALIALTGIIPADVHAIDFLITILFLTITNLIYSRIGRNLFGDKSRRKELQRLLLYQMFGDFTALSFLTYSLGCIETPMGALFMAHVILATILFSRWQSLVIAVASWVYASLPLMMEWAGIIPQRSIFQGQFKTMVNASFGVTLGFVLASGGVYLVCWYLVSEISFSLKLRERQLEDAHQMLIKIDREKTQSTLLATHELKAPFAAIKSYVYTLRDGYCGELPEKAGSVVTRIGDRCDQISSRITDIIHLSNLRTLVVTEMNLAPVDLISVLSEEAKDGALIGEPRKIKIINLAENHPPVLIMGSQEHLKTLFSNLIQNAINYCYNNTGRVVISLETSPGKVEVSVQDNGIGIPKNALEKIFNDHFRSKNAVAHHAGGTGLGLSIVKEIVVLHGASIQVESIVGRGSSFNVRFNTISAMQEKFNYGENTDN
ncbi:MAG: HAMP domain-containing sensor histidine kinase [Acidobacteriota bacterium]